ncbi:MULTISPECIES: branched-chain amino acid ABC transporter permease [Maritimibacter]|jgi:branched-chain amino acid transport system permease protein|uniref:Possible ABC transport system permease protein n=1 Tax=Maritimibacter alkaliphilus HTCC2654 TaxID=314271 RepID=A3VC11_9RHOB|nr:MULTISPECIES: branched-chain amino acid ABC transporter permease [Maritimibacter]EAQ14494.1 possible ABC transport system permease protein [Rhodobacterales bacterium HTCC2654] [Maritimibacter alkaliphilus HTCC2654]MBL6427134.1 branched-chain amino acid ABC transporter permease [Maritimibacter sp.]TYP82415.1 amino acid/amide ABC transporter membrane protein 1 (HAAT family) [Maritimibacter alkaliphilus HTCC2654]
METIVFGLLNGVSYGLLLFMLSSGLTLIFSMMGVLNFAHASFYMLGAYFAFTITGSTSFWIALFIAPVLVGLVGALVERYGLRKVHANGHVAELLFTFGLAYLIEEVVKIVYGKTAVDYRVPDLLNFAAFEIYGATFPAYRIFVIFIAIAMLVGLWFLLKRTRAGLIIQAALTHPHMVGHLGHNVPFIFMTVFGIGCALAGLAGLMAGNIFVTDPAMAVQMGPIVFVVVVVGGIGSLEGAFLASLLIGLLQNFAVGINASFAEIFAFTGLSPTSEVGDITISSLAPVLPFLLLVLMLIFRPQGLMGEQEL